MALDKLFPELLGIKTAGSLWKMHENCRALNFHIKNALLSPEKQGITLDMRLFNTICININIISQRSPTFH